MYTKYLTNNGNSCWTKINSYACYYQPPSDYLNVFELARAIDWHMKFYDTPMWEGPND